MAEKVSPESGLAAAGARPAAVRWGGVGGYRLRPSLADRAVPGPVRS